MKRMMKKALLFSLACASLTILTGCGGEPERYDEKSQISVFVWKQTAYAEHPGVENDGDFGTPISARRRLIGKNMALIFNVNGLQQRFSVFFDTQLHCNVQTVMPAFPLGGTITSISNSNTYTYEVTDKDGQQAALTINYVTELGYLASLKANLTFTNARQATATIQELRLLGDLTGQGENVVVPGTVGNVEWTVIYE